MNRASVVPQFLVLDRLLEEDGVTGDAYGPYDPDFVEEERDRLAQDKVLPKALTGSTLCPEPHVNRGARLHSVPRSNLPTYVHGRCGCRGVCRQLPASFSPAAGCIQKRTPLALLRRDTAAFDAVRLDRQATRKRRKEHSTSSCLHMYLT